MFSMFKKNKSQPTDDSDLSGPIFPRLKSPEFLQGTSEISGITEEQMPVAVQLTGDLILTFAIDIGPSFVAVSHAEMAKRNLNLDTMFAEAMQNSAPLFSNIQTRTNGTIHQIETGNDMEACTFLLGDLWQSIEKDLGEEPIAIFPHRNAVFFTGKGTPGGLEGLKEVLMEIDFNETHALSKLVFIWRGENWDVLDS